ncbi:hypothetical protein TSAR_010657 [Trichomalopsis sarcophagae]|uniref:Uncharacterized protein n=1 Tax=Trichomalopsis sarcophagae TaxID=543379 RepID=A0A232EIB3_9HYME|nr:hypothetical protein TSAR_010657 [Trichomalopsis sarcophagae]
MGCPIFLPWCIYYLSSHQNRKCKCLSRCPGRKLYYSIHVRKVSDPRTVTRVFFSGAIFAGFPIVFSAKFPAFFSADFGVGLFIDKFSLKSQNFKV